MGFTVKIESDGGSEILQNYPTGGKAVFAFLSGLQAYNLLDDNDKVARWYEALEKQSGEKFSVKFRELLDCMWGDGGDSTVYREDEWEIYKLRNPNIESMMTEETFKKMVVQYWQAFQSTEKVRDEVQFLLELFKNAQPEALEGFYVSEDSIPDFEALLTNLDLLISRGSQDVRLNFS
jgi:hypothetical protein